VAQEPEPDESTVVRTGPLLAGAAAERDEIGHYLLVIEGGEPGRRILLGSAPLTVGRDAARDLVLVDSDISRFHLQVSVQQDAVVVEDQQSTNGTRINGQRVTGTAVLDDGGLLQVGHHVLKLERRSKRDVERQEELDRDLDKASRYVRSQLPAPLVEGAIRTDWCYQPSTRLGGDAFGYDQLDADTFVVYLIDVSGHGVGAAMHAVSVLNVLRKGAVLNADPLEPASVFAGLNAMFPMERHDGLFFTMWYGVYHQARRLLRYACAGHHAGFLVTAGRETSAPLRTPGLMIGATPDARYHTDEALVPAGSSLYLFSDGVFEIVTRDQTQWRLKDFEPVILQPAMAGTLESQRLYAAVKAAARPGPLDDDFSLLVVTFA
jgi:serine phosphatase RsbU (regulator of sigma subunit)